jgi:hypothetical protein
MNATDEASRHAALRTLLDSKRPLTDEERLDALQTELGAAGLYSTRTMTGGGCEALMVTRDKDHDSTHVLITNGDAQLPYLLGWWTRQNLDESELDPAHPLVDEDLFAGLYVDGEDEKTIIDHDGAEGILPTSLILAAVRSALS